MSIPRATSWPRALVRVAWAGTCSDDDPYWWPCLAPTHPYSGQWVPMVGDTRDYDREPEPLTDEDREVLIEVSRAHQNGRTEGEAK